MRSGHDFARLASLIAGKSDECSSTAEQPNYEQHKRDHQEHMDKRSHGVRADHAEQPCYEQDER
jgi:hypothetical protein